MAKTAKIGTMVYLPQKKKYGTVVKLASNGKVAKVDTGDEIVDVLMLIVEIVPVLKQLWLIIKSLFKRK